VEIIIGAAVFVFLLWEGGYPGWAALIALGGCRGVVGGCVPVSC
jgi:hypothetical protein